MILDCRNRSTIGGSHWNSHPPKGREANAPNDRLSGLYQAAYYGPPMRKPGALLAVVSLAAAVALPKAAFAQGCVAFHSNSTMLGCLTGDGPSGSQLFRKHPITVEVDWRSFSSFRHFIGEK